MTLRVTNFSGFASGRRASPDTQEDYSPLAVNFDGTEYLYANGWSLSNSQKFLYANWFRRGAISQRYVSASNGVLTIFDFGNALTCRVRNAATNDICTIAYNWVADDSNNWHHYIIQIDMTNINNCVIVRDGTIVATAQPGNFIQGETIAWSTVSELAIGGVFTGQQLSSFDIAQIYMAVNPPSSFNFNLQANVERFYEITNPSNFPEFLGVNGNVPTGQIPNIFIDGSEGDWTSGTNTGSGPNFILLPAGNSLTGVSGPTDPTPPPPPPTGLVPIWGIGLHSQGLGSQFNQESVGGTAWWGRVEDFQYCHWIAPRIWWTQLEVGLNGYSDTKLNNIWDRLVQANNVRQSKGWQPAVLVPLLLYHTFDPPQSLGGPGSVPLYILNNHQAYGGEPGLGGISEQNGNAGNWRTLRSVSDAPGNNNSGDALMDRIIALHKHVVDWGVAKNALGLSTKFAGTFSQENAQNTEWMANPGGQFVMIRQMEELGDYHFDRGVTFVMSWNARSQWSLSWEEANDLVVQVAVDHHCALGGPEVRNNSQSNRCVINNFARPAHAALASGQVPCITLGQQALASSDNPWANVPQLADYWIYGMRADAIAPVSQNGSSDFNPGFAQLHSHLVGDSEGVQWLQGTDIASQVC